MQRWCHLQDQLLPFLEADLGCVRPRLEKLIHILELTRIEDFVSSAHAGRPPHERGWFANAFVAEVVLEILTARGLIDRLQNDCVLRRLCGFSLTRALPSESSFSRAFADFAQSSLAKCAHKALVKHYLGDELIGHISRDATAIEAREKPKDKSDQRSVRSELKMSRIKC